MKLKLRDDEVSTIMLALAEFILTRREKERIDTDNFRKADKLLGQLIFYQRQIEEDNDEE